MACPNFKNGPKTRLRPLGVKKMGDKHNWSDAYGHPEIVGLVSFSQQCV
jgi:hypothetical protein